MSVEWTEARIYKLVLSYIRQECLWKHDNDNYDNFEARKNAYINIIRDVNIKDLTVNQVKDKIKQIRRIYRLELAKINDANFRGFPYKPNITWFELIHGCLCAYITNDEDFKIDNSLHINKDEEKYSNDRYDIPLQSLSSLQRRYTIKERPSGIRYSYFPIKPNHLDTFTTKLTKNGTSLSQGKIISHSSLQNEATVPHPHFILTQQQIASTTAAALQKPRNSIGSELKSTTGDYSSIINHRNDPEVIIQPLNIVKNSNKKHNKIHRKYGDEFEVFGKSVACQLRELSLPHALRTQTKIQNLLAEERIDSNRDKKEINDNEHRQRRTKDSRRHRRLFNGDSHATQSSKSSHSSINYHSNF